MNSESLTHYLTESESRTPDWTLRTTGEHPLPGREITARRRQSSVRRFLRLRRPTPFGRGTAVICLLTALCAGTVVILSGRSAGLSLATGSETTDDAYVRADQIAISSHITGYIESAWPNCEHYSRQRTRNDLRRNCRQFRTCIRRTAGAAPPGQCHRQFHKGRPTFRR